MREKRKKGGCTLSIAVPDGLSEAVITRKAAEDNMSKWVIRTMLPYLPVEQKTLKEIIKSKEVERDRIIKDHEMDIKNRNDEIAWYCELLEKLEKRDASVDTERANLRCIARNYPMWVLNRGSFEHWICDNLERLYACGFKTIDEAYAYLFQNDNEKQTQDNDVAKWRNVFLKKYIEMRWDLNKTDYCAWAASEEGISMLKKCEWSKEIAYENGKGYLEIFG